MASLDEEIETIEFEPIPDSVPEQEPAAPVVEPEREPVPA